MKALIYRHPSRLIVKCLYAWLVVGLLTSICRAELGENEQQIRKRFGIKDKADMACHTKRVIQEVEHALYFALARLPPPQLAALSAADTNNWDWANVKCIFCEMQKFQVFVLLLNNKSVFESYGHDATLSETQMTELLAANSKYLDYIPPAIIPPAPKAPAAPSDEAGAGPADKGATSSSIPPSGNWSMINNPIKPVYRGIVNWKMTDPNTGKVSRYAVTNGGRSVCFYAEGFLDYCKKETDDVAARKTKAETGSVSAF